MTNQVLHYGRLLHLINIHDLITPFHWSILPIDTFLPCDIFAYYLYDLIPKVTFHVIKHTTWFYLENMAHYFPSVLKTRLSSLTLQVRDDRLCISTEGESIVPYFPSNHVVQGVLDRNCTSKNYIIFKSNF